MKRFIFMLFSLLIFSTVVSFDVGATSLNDPPGYTELSVYQAEQNAVLFSMPELKTDVFRYRQIVQSTETGNLQMWYPDAFVYPDYGLKCLVCVNNLQNKNYKTNYNRTYSSIYNRTNIPAGNKTLLNATTRHVIV